MKDLISPLMGQPRGSFTRASLRTSCSASRATTPLVRLTFVLAGMLIWTATVFAHPGNRAAGAQGPGTDLLQPSGPVLLNHTPPQVISGEARLSGHYPAGSNLRLAVALRRPDPEGEERFIRELMDPDSPNFHAFLTPEQWNARFAPSAEDEEKVLAWAASEGLKVTNRFPNRLLVDLEAPAGVIEHALGVTINKYAFQNEVDFSNDRDPVVPPSLSGVVTAVLGLNNIQRMHGQMRGVPEMRGPDYAPGPAHADLASDHGDSNRPRANLGETDISASPNMTGGYIDPVDIYSSQTYDYAALRKVSHCCNPHNDVNGAPNVSSIAIAAWGGFQASDIKAFAIKYGLAWNWNAYAIDGNPSCPSGQSPPCPSDETTLDTEWTTATSNSFGSSNQTAHIYVYIAGAFNEGTNADLYNQMLSDNKAKVFTTSWSCTENYGCSSGAIATWHTIFNFMVGQGWTLMAASGDHGSADDCYFNNPAHTSVGYPGSDPDVLGIGGTALLVYFDGTFKSETAWQGKTSFQSCQNNGGGSGGGKSAIFSSPAYQAGLGSISRLVPDISLNSGGVGQNYYFNGQWHGVGGTSIAAPEYAGFFAQENAYLNFIGHICGANNNLACTPIGQPHGLLYYEGKNKNAAHNPFYDILTGCNSNDATNAAGLTVYCAHGGYDLVTGWGSANMLQLAWALNWELLGNHANGVPYVTFTGPAKNTWYNTNQTIFFKVNDYAGNKGPKGTGIAGFAAAWDSLPSDPASQPHGGTGNLFYSGPLKPLAGNGCVSFTGAGCGAAASNGCHTAHVHGWNNEGWTTAGQSLHPETYGPVCYDTVSPSTAYAVQGSKQPDGSYTGPTTVTLTATDPGSAAGTGSGVKTTYFSLDNSTCMSSSTQNCKVYSAAVTIPAGSHKLYYFSLDGAGNFEALKTLTIKVN